MSDGELISEGELLMLEVSVESVAAELESSLLHAPSPMVATRARAARPLPRRRVLVVMG
jgi:hypothetical protein